MNKKTILAVAAAALVNQVISAREENPHVHPEMRGEVTTDTLRPPTAIIRQDVVVNLTGVSATATAGDVVVHAR